MYKKVEVLNKETDKTLRVSPLKGFEYAKDLTNCAVTVGEFAKAKNSLPIVFYKNDTGYGAIAILGLEDSNSFVQKDGSWEEKIYIPAFVRRYPFVFIDAGEKLALGLDKECKAVNKKSGQALFTKDGELTEYTNGVMKFMESYQKEATITSQIVKELDELGVLEDAQLNIGSGKEAKTFKGFKKVNEEKLNALDDKVLANMTRNGAYKVILAHLESLANFSKLAK